VPDSIFFLPYRYEW